MPSQSRRRILQLSAAGLVGLAGCTSGGSDDSGNNNRNSNPNDNGGEEPTERPDVDNDGVPDIEDDFPNDSDLSRQLSSTSDTRKIEEDEWRYYELEFSSTGQIYYDFIVREGPEIDVILMEKSEYTYFESEQRAEYFPDLSALDSAGETVEGKVNPGSYYLVFDNSPNGEAAPPTNFSNDIVTVEFEIETAE